MEHDLLLWLSECPNRLVKGSSAGSTPVYSARSASELDHAPTHGALTAAAVGSLIVGALILFNSPGSMPYLRVSVPLVIGTSVLLGGAFFVMLIYALRARKLPVATGVETLVGKVGHVTQTLNPRGIVQLEAEEWSAESVGGTIDVGQSVEVVEVTGVRLRVRKK